MHAYSEKLFLTSDATTVAVEATVGAGGGGNELGARKTGNSIRDKIRKRLID